MLPRVRNAVVRYSQTNPPPHAQNLLLLPSLLAAFYTRFLPDSRFQFARMGDKPGTRTREHASTRGKTFDDLHVLDKRVSAKNTPHHFWPAWQLRRRTARA